MAGAQARGWAEPAAAEAVATWAAPAAAAEAVETWAAPALEVAAGARGLVPVRGVVAEGAATGRRAAWAPAQGVEAVATARGSSQEVVAAGTAAEFSRLRIAVRAMAAAGMRPAT